LLALIGFGDPASSAGPPIVQPAFVVLTAGKAAVAISNLILLTPLHNSNFDEEGFTAALSRH
jgi:hypothetical protein